MAHGLVIRRATLENALKSDEKVHVSLALAQGLFLDMSILKAILDGNMTGT